MPIGHGTQAPPSRSWLTRGDAVARPLVVGTGVDKKPLLGRGSSRAQPLRWLAGRQQDRPADRLGGGAGLVARHKPASSVSGGKSDRQLSAGASRPRGRSKRFRRMRIPRNPGSVGSVGRRPESCRKRERAARASACSPNPSEPSRACRDRLARRGCGALGLRVVPGVNSGWGALEEGTRRCFGKR
jgi:hypothetical protein